MSDQHDELAAQRALHELRTQWQQTLDADGTALDADVTARLDQVRGQALRTAPALRRRALLAVPVAAVLLLALTLPLAQKMLQEKDQMMSVPVSDVDFDVSELEPWQEDTELIDDLDFYAWLALEAEHAS